MRTPSRRLKLVLTTILTLAARPSALGSGFLTPPFYNVAQAPAGAAAADFNGDGKSDLVTADPNANSISVLLNNGDGAFLPAVNYSTGSDNNSYAVAVGDFNGDGKIDIAASGDGCCGGQVVVFLGNGDGTFQPFVAYATGTFNPGSLVAADVNGDGRLDLVASGLTSSLDAEVSVQLGKGDGTFRPAILSTLTIIGSTRASLVVGDFNKDSKADVAMLVRGQLVVLLGNSDGTFQTTAIPFGTELNSVATGDMNNDGTLDLVTANVDGSASVFVGNGDGTFQSPLTSAAGASGPLAITVVDLNRDGKLDVVTGGASPGSVNVFLGQGNGNLNSPVAYAVGTGPAFPGAIVAADFNADGSPDVICTNDLSSTVTVLFGSRSGALHSLVEYLSQSGPIAVGDFNSDGKLDIVTPEFSANQFGLWLGKGGVAFLPPVSFAVGKEPDYITAADFNGDGTLDVATNNISNVSVVFGNGDGTFQSPVNYNGIGHDPTPNANITSADVNGDGKPDLEWITTPTGASAEVAVMLNKGDGSFLPPVEYQAGKAAQSVTFADFNGDGKLDMAAAVRSPGPYYPVEVFLGNGDGTFQSPLGYPADLLCTQVIAADVNGDGKQDLVLACGFLAVLLGNGDGTFQAVTVSGPGPETLQIATGDFNGDGKLDIASAGLTLGIYYGNGDGTFTYADLGLAAINVSVANFNGDNAPDLAFDNYAGGVLALANTGGTSDVLISSPNPSRLHQRVTFKAAVKATVKGSPGGTPTGSVIFEDNGSALATVTLQNGVATYQTSTLGVGTHQITAVYLGDSNFNPNVSQTLVQIVKQ